MPCFKVKIKIHTSLFTRYAVRGITAAFEYKNQFSSSQISLKAGNYNKGHESTRKQHSVCLVFLSFLRTGTLKLKMHGLVAVILQ